MDTRQQTGERKAAELWPSLPYDAWKASSPEQVLLEFFQSTYEAGATLAHWDREALERRAG